MGLITCIKSQAPYAAKIGLTALLQAACLAIVVLTATSTALKPVLSCLFICTTSDDDTDDGAPDTQNAGRPYIVTTYAIYFMVALGLFIWFSTLQV